jgi:para-aminobenzoate synthetase component I
MADDMGDADAALETRLAVRELAGDFAARVAGLRRAPLFWWLDSALAGPRLGRFSFAGADPVAVLRARGRRVSLEVRRDARPDLAPGVVHREADPLEALRALLPPPPPQGALAPALPFAGGAVGVIGYELAEGLDALAPLSLPGRDDLGLPDVAWLLVDRLLAFDHLTGRSFAVGLGVARHGARAAARADEAAAAIAAEPRDPAGFAPEPAGRAPALTERPVFDEVAHGQALAEVQACIAAGDVYQACLTHRIDAPFAGDPWQAYLRLRRVGPAPFAAYLALPDAVLASGSPERFLAVSPRGLVESRPIKGTRPRRPEPVLDRAEAAALAGSAKDRAENLMIVDLVRNDLGRVCEIASVHVPELMVVESYATVFQLVSTVRGRLREGVGVFDAIRATFPPGSMTGAPKRAAMQLLARLEPVRRGFYAGALGYLDVRGGADLSVVIRTACFTPGRASFHTGGGIVADSEPAAEWREAEDKLAALRAALGCGAAPAAVPGACTAGGASRASKLDRPAVEGRGE